MSKGDAPRPLSVPLQKFRERYDRTFSPARCADCGGVLGHADGEPMGWPGFTRWECVPCAHIQYIKNDMPPEAA